MKTAAIRQKLHNYLEAADDKKIKALYTIVEEDIEEMEVDYTDELKQTLDTRIEKYEKGLSKPVSAAASKKRIQKILKS